MTHVDEVSDDPVRSDRPVKILARAQVLALFGFMFFAFMVLAYRTEHNAGLINQVIYNNCQASNAYVEQVNRSSEILISIERSNSFVDETTRQRRIMAYQGAERSLANCRKP